MTDFFIKRPVFAICLNLIVLFAGYRALTTLPTRQYPKSDLAVVTVTTAYVGADAELIQGFITTPLERAIASADGIDYLKSSSIQGISTINAHLKLNFDVDAALSQIQAKVNQVKSDLPQEAESSVISVETADNRIASMYISFYSDTLESNQITDYLVRTVQPRLSSILGVEKADILGNRTYALRAWLKPEKLLKYNLSPAEVSQAISDNNFLSAIGSTKGNLVSVNLKANTDLSTVDEFQKLVVKKSGTAQVTLGMVADVELGAENYDQTVRFDGKTATFIGVWALPNANVLDVIADVRAALPEIEDKLPEGLNLGVAYDATDYIEQAISEVFITLLETVIIVILVIALFIGSIRSVIVPVIAIPLSLVGACGLMILFGFTVNLLTLLAIVLAVGLVVDDAIVMLENVERHIQDGLEPIEAAKKAARELAGPVIAMTITLAAVYAPIGLQGGLTGTLFKEFALTLAGAVIVSGFVALTLSPVMSAKLIPPRGTSNKFQNRVSNILERLTRKYESALNTLFLSKTTIILSTVILTFLAAPLYMFSSHELAPKEDQGVVFGILLTPPNSTLEYTDTFAKQIREVFTSVDEYENSFELIGATEGFSGILTKPYSERKRTTLELEPIMSKGLGEIPGVQALATTPAPLPGGSDFPVEFVISSTDDAARLLSYAQTLVETAFSSGKFMFADPDLKFDMPEAEILINREKVAALGLSMRDIGQEIGALVGGNYVNRFNISGRGYKVIPQVQRSERLNPSQLNNIHIRGPNQTLIPLSSFASINESVKPRSLNKFQQLNSVTIRGLIPPGVTLDQGLKVLEEKAKEILPSGYSIDYAGESRQLRAEGDSLTQTLLFSLVLIYLVLAAQFESFRDPFIVLAGSVPLALTGALMFPFLGATSINIYSQVGLVTLVGLVAKNGILIVEFANELKRKGKNKKDAVISASCTRLRPILMTSFATVVGHFPLIIASGAGAAARNSIGIVLVSGMFIGTFFTLFVVPLLYEKFSSES